MRKSMIVSILIKAVLPSVLCMFFLWLMLQGAKEQNPSIYNFNPEDTGNVVAVGIGEFKASLDSKSDSIFLFCSNEDKNCYQMLKDMNDLGISVEYLNVLEFTDMEKEELQSMEFFKDKLYPKLIIIKNNNISSYGEFLSKEDLRKIL